MEMKLKPLAGYVLIEPIDEEETTASGLVLPEKVKDKPSKGKVIAISEFIMVDGEAMDCPVKAGQLTVYHRWAGQDVKEGQKEYRLVKFQDLMAVYG